MGQQVGLVDRRIHPCTKARVNCLQSFGVWSETFTDSEEEKVLQGLRDAK